jgi:DNA-binding transcriptional ArsR family regulator
MALLQVSKTPEIEVQNGAKHFVPGFNELRQVVSIIGVTPDKRRRIIQRLNETGYIFFAGWVGVNYYPIARQSLRKAGGDVLSITVKVARDATPPKGVLTPWGYRGLTSMEEATYITLVGDQESLRIMPEQHLLPSKDRMAKGETVDYVTTPIVVPVLAVDGIGTALVYISYITADGRRIPALLGGEKVPNKLYAALLDVDACSQSEIVRFLATHQIYFGHQKEDTDLIEAFCNIQRDLRELLKTARTKLVALAPVGEAGLVNLSLISQLASANGCPDFVWFCDRYSEEPKTEEQDEALIPVTRFYTWEDYLRWELIRDLTGEGPRRVCKRCGIILTPSRSVGRPSEYCAACQQFRSKERTHRHRERRRQTEVRD